LVAAVASLLSTPASAEDRSLRNAWTILDDSALQGERILARGDYVFKQRLAPIGLAELGEEGVAVAGLAGSSQLIEVQSPGAIVFCDPALRARKMLGHAQPCLVDSDRDGRFEGMFLTSSTTKGILMVQGNRPKVPKPIVPIAYRRLEVSAFALRLFVGVEYRGNSNPAGNHIFQVNYGSDGAMESLTERFAIGKVNLPATRTPFGGEFELLSESSQGIRIRVSRTIPAQPFGVVKTVTYTIY
jgi:hypothetical protein